MIPQRQTLGDLLRRTAQRFPHKEAIIFGDETWTYAEFDARCNRLANGLIARGVKPGDRVALLSYNSNTFAAIRFAVARAGAVLVPVNFMLNAREAAYNVGHSGARWLLASSDFVDRAAAIAALDTDVEHLVWLPGTAGTATPPGWLHLDDLLVDNETSPDIAGLVGSDPAQIIYTSGTESLPKGAVLSHDAVIWQYTSCIIAGEIASGDRILHALPLFHCAQLDVFLGPGIYVGATNVIVPNATPDTVLPALIDNEINSFFCPPTVWIALLRSPEFDAHRLAGLGKGYYGAAIMPKEVLRELSSRLPNLRLWNFYGQTEIAPLATALGPEEQLTRLGSAGRPVLNVETRVVNDHFEDVAPGETGEIVHRSPHLMDDYYRDEERSAAAFAGGWFHSGDLATVDADGYLYVVDRKKDMIKTGGENVASREVEETIYLLPGVAEVAVVGVPHPYWIEAIVAVVVVRDGASLDAEEVIAHCRTELAGFKVPKDVLFASELPKNPSGKVLKRDLREHYADLFADRG